MSDNAACWHEQFNGRRLFLTLDRGPTMNTQRRRWIVVGFARGTVALLVVAVCALLATMGQYVAQHEPGSKAAFALERVLVEFELPDGRATRYTPEYIEKIRELGRRFDSAALPDGTIRPEYREAWAYETDAYMQMLEKQRLAPWREAGDSYAPGAYSVSGSGAHATRVFNEPVEWGAIFASSWRTMLEAPRHAFTRYGGGSTLAHPPQMGFVKYLDDEGLTENGCVLLDWSSFEGASWSLGFAGPFYFTALTGIGVVWYWIYHVLAVSIIAAMCALGGRVSRSTPENSLPRFSRLLALSALLAIPLPAFFEVIWKAWWAYESTYDHETGANMVNGVVYTTPALAGVWAGVAVLHAMIILSLRRGRTLDPGDDGTPRMRKLRSWFAYRWWQLSMLAISVVLLWTPMLLGWYNRLYNEGVI